MMQRLASLRSRLLLLVLFAVMPIFALVLCTDLERRREAVTVVREEALRVARIAASEQNDLFQRARQLVFILAQLPAVRSPDARTCRPLLVELLGRSPVYTNVSVAAPTGEVRCSAVPIAGPVNFGDRGYFQRAITTRDVAMSGYLIGRISGKPNVAIAYPAVDARAVC